MTLSFKVLGYTLASIELEIPADHGDVATAVEAVETAVDRGVKRVSNWWLRKLSKG